MTVGQLVEQVDVAVSVHLKILSEARFVLFEPRCTSRMYRVNQRTVMAQAIGRGRVITGPVTAPGR